jgi:hypothetical protein
MESKDPEVISFKCTAVVEEYDGWMKQISLFLDNGKAKRVMETKMAALGLHYDQDKEAWADKEGRTVGYAEFKKGWCSIHRAEIQDMKIDVTILKEQIKAVLESNMPEEHKIGVKSLLGTILEACTGD